MSFWSKLGKILAVAGPIAATPFTGGASLLGLAGAGATAAPLIGAGLGALGSVASGASAGRAAGRVDEAGINQNQDQIGLQAARLNLLAPQQRAQNATRGDLLANLQDVNVGAPRGTRLSGGTRPSLMSGDTRALGKQLSRAAYLSQMKGDAFTPTPLPQSGKTDTLLNILGGVGAFGGALNAARKPQMTIRPPVPINPAPWRNVRF